MEDGGAAPELHSVTRRLLHAMHRTAYTGAVVAPPTAAHAAVIMDALFA